MLAEPLKETPPIVRDVVSVAADPDHAPPVSVAVPSEKLVPETAPVKVPVVPETAPEKVPVVPETAPVKVPAPPETVPVAVKLVTETEFTVKAPLTVRSFWTVQSPSTSSVMLFASAVIEVSVLPFCVYPILRRLGVSSPWWMIPTFWFG